MRMKVLKWPFFKSTRNKINIKYKNQYESELKVGAKINILKLRGSKCTKN